MTYTVIACQTLRDELGLVIRRTGCKYPVIWIESEYHIDPERLRSKLQQEIDALSNVDNILFAYGYCGNGLVGLRASTANLVIPKTDDCISMLLSRPGEKYQRHKQTYFLTKGWLEGSKSIAKEHAYMIERYGEIRAKRLFSKMFEHYRYLMLIDTGAYDSGDYLRKVEELAKDLGLEPVMEKGNLWFLRKLLLGPYDKDFCTVRKGEVVALHHFGYAQGGPTQQQL